MAEVRTVRQERAIKTRETILTAAAVTFDRLGYELTTISDILAEAALTKGALYFHFPSKEALAQAVMTEQVNLVTVPQSGLHMQSLIDLTFDVSHKLQTNPLMRAGIRLTIEQGTWKETNADPYRAWVDLIEELLTRAEQDGELLPGVDTQQAAQFVVGAFTGVQLLSQVLTHRTDLDQRLTAFWDFTLPGMVNPGLMRRLRTQVAESAK